MSTKKAEARERVKAMREEQARKDRARERMMRLSIAIAVLVGVAIIAVAVLSNDDNGGGDGSTGNEPVAVPEAAESQVEGSGILVGDPDAPVTIDYWMDFLCPHCQEFEAVNGGTIDQLVDSGQANIVYHPVTFTGGVNSTRANNAFACAADEGVASEVKSAAFAQPERWTNNSLVDLGEQLGVGGDYESCVRDGTYEAWSSSVTAQAEEEEQVKATPTVFVNGELLDSSNWTPAGLTAAVQAAAGGEASEPTSGAGGETGAAENTDGEDADGENADDSNAEDDPGADDD